MAVTVRPSARKTSTAMCLVRPIAIALLLAGAAIIPIQAVAAGPPMQASGTVQPTTFNLTSIRFADGNVILDGREVLVISGSFTGRIDQADEIVVHPDGTAVDHFVGTLDAAVVGCGSGTIPLQGEALIVGNALDGQLSFIDQSANTMDARAELKVSGNVPNLLYTGTYLCG